MSNSFLKSLRDQVDRGKALSKKQFGILARTTGENAGGLPDHDAICARLAEFVPEGFAPREEDPVVPGILKAFEGFTAWRPPTQKGKRLYDDKGFVVSLADQYARRRVLSTRQISALKHVARTYCKKDPDFAKKMAALGLGGGDDAQAE